MTEKIIIEQYNPCWQYEFNIIKEMINLYIGDLILSVEHVGSTSINGLAAKPIIDIDVIIDNYDVFPEIKERLRQKEYIYEGNLGIEDREAFKRNSDKEYFNSYKLMKYHLYVCPKYSKELIRHIAFRNYLKENEWARKEYQALKIKLANEFTYDRVAYTEHKTEFINKILNKIII
jgi:GrpB-like predicted nucleotidyltransferase (UPF0157 family)